MSTERYSGEAYRSDLAQRLRRIPDKQVRKEHLELVKESQRDGQKYTDGQAAKMIYSRDARAQRSIVETFEPELTPQEIKTREIIGWAEDLHAEYLQRLSEYGELPKIGRKERDRARQHQRQTDKLVQSAARESLGDFERFDTALGVWRSKDMESQDTQQESSFYSQVVKQMELQTRQEWKKFSNVQIAELIKRRAYPQLMTDVSNRVR